MTSLSRYSKSKKAPDFSSLDWGLIFSPIEYGKVLSEIEDGEHIVYDTETTGLGYESELIGVAFYFPKIDKAYFVVTLHSLGGMLMKHFVEVSNKHLTRFEVIGHNLVYDQWVIAKNGLNRPKIHADTIVCMHLTDCNLKMNLEYRTAEDLGYKKKKYEEIIGKKWNKVDWIEDCKSGLITAENMGHYACEDVLATYYLYLIYYDRVYENKKLLALHDSVEIPLIEVLTDMKLHGVNIDVECLEEMEIRAEKAMTVTENDIYDLAGCTFNINSGKQKGEVLYDKLKLPVLAKTKGGARATDTKTLKKLAEKGHEIANILLKYSEVAKLLSTYIRAIPTMTNSDGMLRCNFNSLGTSTGRFSSSQPNLQNQPNNDTFPVRKSFIPSEGNILLVADYSQIEPRIMAHLSKDPKMLKIYNDDHGDIYLGIAEELGITRKQAKVVQLAVSYGIAPETLAAMLKLSPKEGKNIVASYYSTYRYFKAWKEHVEKVAVANRYAQNLYGRIRPLPEITQPRFYYSGLRKAVNMFVQGTAADILKLAMIKYHTEIKERNLQTHLMLQVHDELVAEAPLEFAEESYNVMVESMEKIVNLRVPLIADGKLAYHWSQMKDDDIGEFDLLRRPPIIEGLSYADLLNYGAA